MEHEPWWIRLLCWMDFYGRLLVIVVLCSYFYFR